MRAMNHPDYQYQPHSAERRRAASEREKARHAASRRKITQDEAFCALRMLEAEGYRNIELGDGRIMSLRDLYWQLVDGLSDKKS